MALPNPPVKRLKLKSGGAVTAIWLCTEEGTTLATIPTKVYAWDGNNGLCFHPDMFSDETLIGVDPAFPENETTIYVDIDGITTNP